MQRGRGGFGGGRGGFGGGRGGRGGGGRGGFVPSGPPPSVVPIGTFMHGIIVSLLKSALIL